nr:lycopene cyclase family protein [Filimonas effusa]
MAGAGCAGLSMLMRMMKHPFYFNKKILIIDPLMQEQPSKTWCFWEKQEDIFEPVVFHRWEQIEIVSAELKLQKPLFPYKYKMIRSRDLFHHVKTASAAFSDIHWLQANVTAIDNEGPLAFALVNGEKIYCSTLLNSVTYSDYWKQQPERHYLWQHFKGRMIEAEKPVFQDHIARLMDFRTKQESGTCFVYVLPVSPRKALVEFTVFSEALLSQEQYDLALDEYIENILQPGSYSVLETETGAIPMTNHRFCRQSGNILHIGTAGGDTKASTGYTFRFIQKTTARIVAELAKEGDVSLTPWFKARFNLYDSTLLRILRHETMPGDQIFTRLFKKNPPARVFRFLDNETSLAADLPIFSSLPVSVFLPAFCKELFL